MPTSSQALFSAFDRYTAAVRALGEATRRGAPVAELKQLKMAADQARAALVAIEHLVNERRTL